VRVDLTEKDGLTTVRLTHSGLTPEGLQAHKGWPQILVWLRGYVEHWKVQRLASVPAFMD
jgi:hypothetical protein